MKRILITGKNSYVGNAFENWVEDDHGYETTKISLRDPSWKEMSFSSYDVVLHVAGIAHIKETNENKQLYYEINRDLAFEVAEKAKNEGVSQFILLSSMSVFGIDTGIITKETIPKPKTNYGKSKLEAEQLINHLANDSFKVTILRPPMIYGKGCKGNYPRLVRLILKTPIFPDIDNRRSMIFIENLSIYIKWMIDNEKQGVFHPQNNEYVKTSDIARLVAKAHGKKSRQTKLFNPLLKLIQTSTTNKVFGDLIYEKDSLLDDGIQLVDFEKSIYLTEIRN